MEEFPQRQIRKITGFTLFEAMVSISVLSILAFGSLTLYQGVRYGTKDHKLRKDVSTLNAAIKIYSANGGSFAGIGDAEVVLNRLKSVASNSFEKQVVGLKGSALDHRVKAVMQSPKQAATKAPRAIWNSGRQRFVIATEGDNGISGFILDETAILAGETDDRSTNLHYANAGRWVWDYTEAYERDPTVAPTNLPDQGVGSSSQPDSAGPQELKSPIIEITGGFRPLSEYPLMVSVTDPNTEGISEVSYSTEAGIWSTYSGPVEVSPGDTLEVRAVALDFTAWVNSSVASETFTMDPLAPEFALSFPPTVTYMSMGGSLVPGNYPSPQLALPVAVGLSNGADIPVEYQSDAYFQIFWAKDGSDPVGAQQRERGGVFTQGFPDQSIPFGMDDWSGTGTLQIKVQAESFISEVFTHSAVSTAEIAIEPVILRAPVISVDDTTVQITMDSDQGDLPLGASIYFTTDGSALGTDAQGNPVGGQMYTGGFIVPDGAVVTAQVFPPQEYAHWFIASPISTEDVDSTLVSEVYIAGRFALPDGRYRNVSKLAEDGSIDTSFDPGLGASYGSIVAAMVTAPGGGVIVGGDFDAMNNVPRGALVRMRSDGSVDSSFNAGLTYDP